ncbi:hypothetical protein F441_11092 [Phytophthora nicotianae CJ01A1]|uniref:Uncharacterized protein n=5 Tax=Phytophthora nicotianae TaxID=4792 RepID=W2Q4F3_PHYN3|nr:hypothetical protein PPTG_23177 [Phytophthora nicotianae INRA-310]ETK84100.1 hypothetical protein L915_10891 [Phytophthora nicotianae]ETO72758.1 hypothetical protein F444_11238 [Phytophthora nicotianae P1976]ETP13899.1 hypothetical protein F441_11092 [Phytophthora nicotianae CJ01A1]ETP41922.1 hypothetical protein F442_11086 [Phytophthora nicotianae P10297]ETL37535.1 hypothetical protein L916_10782 [Phytophthora nicotianae]
MGDKPDTLRRWTPQPQRRGRRELQVHKDAEESGSPPKTKTTRTPSPQLIQQT